MLLGSVAVLFLVPLDKRSQGKSLEKWKAEGRKEECNDNPRAFYSGAH